MALTEEEIERIQYWIEVSFYYVEYPNPVQRYWWKDREKNWIFMEDMSLDHLKASSKLIERDLNTFRTQIARPEKNPDFKALNKYVIKPAKAKKKELEEILTKKVLQ